MSQGRWWHRPKLGTNEAAGTGSSEFGHGDGASTDGTHVVLELIRTNQMVKEACTCAVKMMDKVCRPSYHSG